jgi:hypothetical protein
MNVLICCANCEYRGHSEEHRDASKILHCSKFDFKMERTCINMSHYYFRLDPMLKVEE